MKRLPPWWLTALILVLMAPMLLFPTYLSQAPEGSEMRMIGWLYPAYVVATGICAWICYRQRPAVTWILIALLVLSHAGMMAIKMDIA